jgi:protein TonB
VKRLALAAVLAVGLHALLLWIQIPWSGPVLPLAQKQPVDIDLAVFQKPAETPRPPAPEPVQPQPKPKPVIKPKPKPRPKPVIRQQPKVKTVVVPPQPEAPAPAETPLPPVPAESREPAARPAPPDRTEAVSAPGPAASDGANAAVQRSQPRYDLNPPPDYPRIARRRSYQGTVLLDVRVSAQGRAVEVKVAQSSGYTMLDQSALNAVHQWIFDPARRNGRPIETWVQVPIRFELK